MHFPYKDLNSKYHFYVEMKANGSFGRKYKEFQEIGFKRKTPSQCHPY